MSDAHTLSVAASRIEETAERKVNLENVEEKVNAADRKLRRINDDLDNLTKELDRLQFHRQILVEAFEGSEPSEVQSALEQARQVSEKDTDAMVRMLRDGKPEAYRSEIQDAVSAVEKANRRVKDRLKDRYWSEWEEKISSAKELQRIIGDGSDEFGATIDKIQGHIQRKMRNPSNHTGGVIAGWEKATTEWKKHQELQGLSSFQKTHGLSDEAVDVIRELSQGSLTLAEIDIDVLRELKDIPDLEAAIDLEI